MNFIDFLFSNLLIPALIAFLHLFFDFPWYFFFKFVEINAKFISPFLFGKSLQLQILL